MWSVVQLLCLHRWLVHSSILQHNGAICGAIWEFHGIPWNSSDCFFVMGFWARLAAQYLKKIRILLAGSRHLSQLQGVRWRCITPNRLGWAGLGMLEDQSLHFCCKQIVQFGHEIGYLAFAWVLSWIFGFENKVSGSLHAKNDANQVRSLDCWRTCFNLRKAGHCKLLWLTWCEALGGTTHMCSLSMLGIDFIPFPQY